MRDGSLRTRTNCSVNLVKSGLLLKGGTCPRASDFGVKMLTRSQAIGFSTRKLSKSIIEISDRRLTRAISCFATKASSVCKRAFGFCSPEPAGRLFIALGVLGDEGSAEGKRHRVGQVYRNLEQANMPTYCWSLGSRLRRSGGATLGSRP